MLGCRNREKNRQGSRAERPCPPRQVPVHRERGTRPGPGAGGGRGRGAEPLCPVSLGPGAARYPRGGMLRGAGSGPFPLASPSPRGRQAFNDK